MTHSSNNNNVTKLPTAIAIGYNGHTWESFWQVHPDAGYDVLDNGDVIDYNLVGEVIPFDPKKSEEYRQHLINKHKNNIDEDLLVFEPFGTVKPKLQVDRVPRKGEAYEQALLDLAWIWEMKEEQQKRFKLLREFEKIRTRLVSTNDNKVSLYGYRRDGRTAFTSLLDYVQEALDHHKLGENPSFIRQLTEQFGDSVPYYRTRIKVSDDFTSDGANLTLKKFLKQNKGTPDAKK